MQRTRRHPVEGAWRAFADGELPLARRLVLRGHVATCADCRQRLAAVRLRGERTRTLIGELAQDVDVAGSWARFGILSGGRLRRPMQWPAFLAGGLSAAVLATGVLLVTPAPARFLGQVHGVGAFANVLDTCCADMSGQGFAREGELTFELPGLDPAVTVQYTDVDGSGTLSTGDIVRDVKRARRRRSRRPRQRSARARAPLRSLSGEADAGAPPAADAPA